MVKNREIKKNILGSCDKRDDSTIAEIGALSQKKNEKTNKATVFTKPTDGAKEAILTYNVIKNFR